MVEREGLLRDEILDAIAAAGNEWFLENPVSSFGPPATFVADRIATVVERAHAALRDIMFALAAVEYPGDPDSFGECQLCRPASWNTEHRDSCPWLRARRLRDVAQGDQSG